jgi:hypothetical protein
VPTDLLGNLGSLSCWNPTTFFAASTGVIPGIGRYSLRTGVFRTWFIAALDPAVSVHAQLAVKDEYTFAFLQRDPNVPIRLQGQLPSADQIASLLAGID